MNSNFRRHLVGLSLLVGVAVPWAATAQAPISNVGSGSVEDRVTQLERISNAHSQLLTQLQQQLSDSQRDVDSLRGQIQENQYQLNQIVERQKQIYQQMESLSGGQGAQGSASAATGAATDNSAAGSSDTAAAGWRLLQRHLQQVLVMKTAIIMRPFLWLLRKSNSIKRSLLSKVL